jgi:hypothetical protein
VGEIDKNIIQDMFCTSIIKNELPFVIHLNKI